MKTIPYLLRGDVAHISALLQRPMLRQMGWFLLVIVLGAGFFGASIGIWRSPLQSLYTAVKLPMVILSVTLGNALLNSMLAPLLGVNISFRQVFGSILISFTIATAILGAFSPIMYFLMCNLPPMQPGQDVDITIHSSLLLFQTAIIAFAGVASHIRLWQLLKHMSGSSSKAWKVLLAWLAGNLLLGSQLSWNLRPFVGSPWLDVEFLRPNAFQSNFFEACLNALKQIIQ